jgi:flavin reductase (DIM6/NTAB) family NADH-FMN oxidoreductase RutF
MEFDLAKLEAKDRYKLLSSTVIPRPIALITTVDEQGRVNAAPYSFFNMFSEDPPTCVIGVQRRPDGRPKDTAHYIREDGEFVVNMVDMDLAEAMNITAINFEPGIDELAMARLTTLPSRLVKPPRIANAPVAFECKRTFTMQLSAERDIVVGQVLTMHAREGLIDPETLYLDQSQYDVVGRLYADLYCPLREVFALKRPEPEQWLADPNQPLPSKTYK